MEDLPTVRLVEFFAGIGGMRIALRDVANVSQSIAYEIAPACVEVYQNNIDHNIKTKLIEQLKPEEIDGMADLWTMSPPCQPFTKTPFGAQQRDSDDPRCKGFKHVMFFLREIKTQPTWIFFENVKNFCGSRMHSEWKETLKTCGYTFRSYLLSPHQIGIPNSRRRFYMACEKSSRFSEVSEQEVSIHFPNLEDEKEICVEISEFMENFEPMKKTGKGEQVRGSVIRALDNLRSSPANIFEFSENQENGKKIPEIIRENGEKFSTEFSQDSGTRSPENPRETAFPEFSDPSEKMESLGTPSKEINSNQLETSLVPKQDNNSEIPSENAENSLFLSEEILSSKWAGTIPIVSPGDRLTFCFTGLYSRQIHKSTGSVVLVSYKDEDRGEGGMEYSKTTFTNAIDKRKFYGHVRKFSPKELLNVFGFPAEFRFPDDLNLRLQWKLVGNSLNVTVVRR
eukprot:TRINITY_DN5842_c0_g1_i4.p1 TRINITY_DN5842_c0_g1~~TRINITY_DN5842_c0_g1_i4.p1  ORF type:complete len:480 (+),score=108.64 TRINITY_DN5842_c0_g1_i4:80-1441(+)